MEGLTVRLAILGIWLLTGVGGQTCWNGATCSALGEPDKQTARDKNCCRYPVGSAERALEQSTCKDCVVTVEGNAPILISIPHGGRMRPSSIQSRQSGCYDSTEQKCIYRHTCPAGTTRDKGECPVLTKSDFRTDELGYDIYNRIRTVLGKCPFLIHGLLHRSKLDLNRNDTLTNGQATFDEDQPKLAYSYYHGNMSRITDTILNNYGGGIVLAIHGYSPKNKNVKWTAMGYRLSYNSLVNKNSSQLDAIGHTSSIKRLVERLTGTETFSSLIYGPRSFGTRLEAEVITINGDNQSLSAVPSQGHKSPFPNEKDYFGATKSPVTNDHRDKVIAIQCEIHKDFRDKSGGKAIRELYQAEYSRAYGNAAANFFNDFYGVTCTNESASVQHASVSPSLAVHGFADCIEYICEEGYSHTAGDLTRMCGLNGWSGTAPTCTLIAGRAAARAAAFALPVETEAAASELTVTTTTTAQDAGGNARKNKKKARKMKKKARKMKKKERKMKKKERKMEKKKNRE